MPRRSRPRSTKIDLAMRQLEIDMEGMEEGSPELAAAESERASLEDTRLGLRNQLVTTNTGEQRSR